MTLCAWLAFQWSLSERRRIVVEQLAELGCNTYYQSTTYHKEKALITSWVYNVDTLRVKGELMQGSVGAIIGWDNWRGLTVFVSSKSLKDTQNAGKVAQLLSALPALNEIVIWDAASETEKWQEVRDFKEEVGKTRPRVRIKHIHVEVPVG
jgi:hypothetical protein